MNKIPANWWKTSFGKSYIKQYKWQEKLTDIQVDFIIKHTPFEAWRYLDVGCGYGRIAIPLALASKKISVAGIDYSYDLIKEAKKRAKKAGVDVHFMNLDVRGLPKYFDHSNPKAGIEWQENYDVVLSIFTSFGYFSDKENFDVLKSFRSLLAKKDKDHEGSYDGTLILDLSNPHHPSVKPHIVDKRIIFDRDQNPGTVRAYTKTEITNLLKKAGFGSIEAYGWYDGSKYEKSSQRLILVAKRAK